MSMINLLLVVWMLQAHADHQAIVQVAADFAKHMKSRDAIKMAECIRLVCEIHQPENDKEPGPDQPSHASFALAFCKYLLASQDFTQAMNSKYNLTVLPSTLPTERDISPWVESVKNSTSIRSAVVTKLKCYQYRVKHADKTTTQRFVNIEGKWYLGSCPFLEMHEWDATRNHHALYVISNLTFRQLPWYFGQARKMAEEGKSKVEVIKYLQDRNMLPRDDVMQTGSSLPMPPVNRP